MNNPSQRNKSIIVAVLSLVTIMLIAAIYVAPTWWVSLTAPNYPEEAFPDGVRINFHMNGVFNGCKMTEKVEIQEDEALDCVHEMDTINHYVGMYPIAAGGPIERGFSQFLMTLLAIMVAGFAFKNPRIRLTVMAVSFGGLAIWMYAAIYGEDGVSLQNEQYLYALVNAIDLDAAKGESEEEVLSAGDALLQRLRQSMAESEPEKEQEEHEEDSEHEKSSKENLIATLRSTFEFDTSARDADEQWTGSGYQVMTWHYGKNLGKYFNEPEKITPMVETLRLSVHIVFFALIGVMFFLLWAARKNGGLLFWLLVLVPMALPLFFLIDYSAWLWWFGHNMNEMGAFSVKPFTPTVFGDGKVAQFTTHSYPSIGFGLMVLMSLVLAAAGLLRKTQFKAEEESI
jgi:pimeloyl-ACP methyl ester carboxylesterase